ncbi:helix-turn-helix domain-containing protein [Neorhizobium sp. DT-125]|uniref:helix-turn-helix domain-containing protein n=1 Tax=Neorhizobium sp. DT-125 TaxID=3396163 RepID=UPI003F196F6F
MGNALWNAVRERQKCQPGWTNKDLAVSLGLSEAYISQVIRGMRDIKLTTLDKMMGKWSLAINELLTVSESDLTRLADLSVHRREESPPRSRRRRNRTEPEQEKTRRL